MPPRRSRSREREPPCGLSPPGVPSNRPLPTSSTRDPSENSHPLVNGASTLLPSRGAPASSTSASFGASTMETNGRPSNYDSTPTRTTLRGPQEEQASKDQTSPPSMPTSPNYFDLLSDMEVDTESPPPPSCQDTTLEEEGTVLGPARGKQPSARVDGRTPGGDPQATGEVSRRYKDNRVQDSNPIGGREQESRTENEPSTPSADDEEEIDAASAADQNRGCCPTPGSSYRPRNHSSRVGITGSGSDSRAAREAEAFIASILHVYRDARREDAPRALPANAGGTFLDSWENYLEKPAIWIDPGPSRAPDPRAVVQWFSFVDRSPSASSVLVSGSPSHVSNSVESSDYDTPSTVPSTVPASPSANGSSSDGSVESGRATRREGSTVWRFPGGSWHPRNIYNVPGTSNDCDSADDIDPARRP